MDLSITQRTKHRIYLFGAVLYLLITGCNVSDKGDTGDNEESDLQIFTALAVIGDSYSDREGENGTSGGPVWTATFADQLGLLNPGISGIDPDGRNYARGGATAWDNNEDFPPPGPAQVASLLNDSGGEFPDTLLVVLWLGGNDMLAHDRTPEQTADAVRNLAETLLDARNPDAGTVYLMIPNVVPFDLMPAFAGSSFHRELADEFNTEMSLHIDTLRANYPDARIIAFDAYSLFEDFVADPSAYGFSNVTEPFNTSGAFGRSGYLWYDDIHPTDAAHKNIGLAMAETIAVATGAEEP